MMCRAAVLDPENKQCLKPDVREAHLSYRRHPAMKVPKQFECTTILERGPKLSRPRLREQTLVSAMSLALLFGTWPQSAAAQQQRESGSEQSSGDQFQQDQGQSSQGQAYTQQT